MKLDPPTNRQNQIKTDYRCPRCRFPLLTTGEIEHCAQCNRSLRRVVVFGDTVTHIFYRLK